MDSPFKFDRPSSASSDSGSNEDVDMEGGKFIQSPTTNSPVAPKSPLKPPKSPTKSSPGMLAKKKTYSTSSERVFQTGLRTVYTAGRPPWYDSHGTQKEAFLIGVCGGSASGKTTVARRIIEALDVPWVSLLSLDSFYKVLDEKQHQLAAENEYNFDHPDAFDYELLGQTLKRLKSGKKVEVPIYNFITHSREDTSKTIYGANVVIFEGIMSFCKKELLPLMDLKIFVDTDSDIRLARRLQRDIAERGRDLEGVLKQYNKFVKPAFEHYIEPTMSCADIIVPRGGENKVAIDLIAMHVNSQLQKRGFKLRNKMAHSADNGTQRPDSLFVLEKTPQVHGLHTFIRNRDTPRDEFIFYSKRLMRLLFEYAMSMLPFKTVAVDTPQSYPYEGRRLDARKICGVSILRAGETMEQALCEVCKDIRLGKILIQTNHLTGEPEFRGRIVLCSINKEEQQWQPLLSQFTSIFPLVNKTEGISLQILLLHYLRLPKDIKESQVMLMDATVATGAAAMMAIRVLLDHDVPEQNITLLSLLMAESGVHTVAYAFPKVKIVTTAVDKVVNDKFHIEPGIGNFGDRYFGTDF